MVCLSSDAILFHHLMDIHFNLDDWELISMGIEWRKYEKKKSLDAAVSDSGPEYEVSNIIDCQWHKSIFIIL